MTPALDPARVPRSTGLRAQARVRELKRAGWPRCEACGTRMDPDLYAAGERRHATCETSP